MPARPCAARPLRILGFPNYAPRKKARKFRENQTTIFLFLNVNEAMDGATPSKNLSFPNQVSSTTLMNLKFRESKNEKTTFILYRKRNNGPRDPLEFVAFWIAHPAKMGDDITRAFESRARYNYRLKIPRVDIQSTQRVN